MGTELMNYILAGVKFKMPEGEEAEIAYEALEDYIDSVYDDDIKSKNGISVIYDGMNGEYIFAGNILEKGNESTGGLDITICEISHSTKEILAAALDLAFGPKGSVAPLTNDEITIADVKIWAFTHWS